MRGKKSTAAGKIGIDKVGCLWYYIKARKSRYRAASAAVDEIDESASRKISSGTANGSSSGKAPGEIKYRGVEQLVARRAHNPEVVGSSPASATRKEKSHPNWDGFFLFSGLQGKPN